MKGLGGIAGRGRAESLGSGGGDQVQRGTRAAQRLTSTEIIVISTLVVHRSAIAYLRGKKPAFQEPHTAASERKETSESGLTQGDMIRWFIPLPPDWPPTPD